jgi:hypothetical protein
LNSSKMAMGHLLSLLNRRNEQTRKKPVLAEEGTGVVDRGIIFP